MTSPSNPSITKAGHIRMLKKCLRNTNWDLSWKEELIEVSADKGSPHWEATAIVDGHPMGTGSGSKLKAARDQAAREALIALRRIKPPLRCVRA